jgi:microcystin degradation protein MlrC
VFRVGVAEFFHETNVFAAAKTGIADFADFRLRYGQELRDRDAGSRTFTAGMFDRLDELGAEAVPLLGAAGMPSGLITTEAFEMLMGELLSRCRDAGPLDGICIALHGAAMSEDYDDLDGEVLRRLRAFGGSGWPIVGTLDLHGNITTAMVEFADALFGTNLYPHTDSYERGLEAASCVCDLICGSRRAFVYLVQVPMMVPPTPTDTGPAKVLRERCQAWEAQPGVADVQVYHGFPMTDGPQVGLSVLAIAERDDGTAAQAASDVAGLAWSLREDFRVPSLSSQQALDAAAPLLCDGGYVVINECSDNAGGGAPGDGTHLLRAMIDRGIPNSAFATIWDPEVVREAVRAGVGAPIRVRLGAKVDALYGHPIEALAMVRAVSDGQFISRTPIWGDLMLELGPCACLRIDTVDVIVASRRMQVYDDGPFEINGVDVAQCRLIGLKSNNHFRAWWEERAMAIVTADPPGATSARLEQLPHRRLRRPIWPLDSAATWTPPAPGATGRLPAGH